MKLSVIIVNYNTCQVTKHCLDSIFQHTRNIDFEVVVVDNDSTDGSKEMLAAYPGIIYVQSGKNLGFGKANNLGYSYTHGQYILLLNSDTLLLNNAFLLFVQEFDNLPDDVGCIGTKLKNADLTPCHSFQKFPSLTSTFRVCVNFLLILIGKSVSPYFSEREYDGKSCFEVDYITGADLCIRREVIEKCGLFDPDFFMYYEETEMQFRYAKSSYKRMIVSSPQIIHLENASTKEKGKKFSFRNRYMFFSSFILFMKKRYGVIKYLLFRMLFIGYTPMFFASYYSTSDKLKMLKLVFSPIKRNS